MQISRVQRNNPAQAASRRRLTAIINQLQAFSFTAPALALMAVFLFYPIGYVIYLSFQKFDLLGEPSFVGWKNYYNILFGAFRPDFLHAVDVSFIFVVLAVPAQVGLGLYLAVLLEREFQGRAFFRSIFFIPMVISFVSAGLAFEWIFSTGAELGVVPQTLANIGIHFPDWRHDGTWGMIMVVIMNTWKVAGFSMILYLAGLQTINHDYYEAAEIDGIGNAWQRFRYISWPLLAPTTTLLIITNTIGSFQAFVPFFVMTNGGPGTSTTTLVYFIYNFFTGQTGLASAAATLFLLGVLMITAVQLYASRRVESYA